MKSFRATSKRTRIETWPLQTLSWEAESFQSNIQENKDWNSRGWETGGRSICFQSNIQENKDWNTSSPLITTLSFEAFRATSKRTRIETLLGPGLARMQRQTFRATSKRTRIETALVASDHGTVLPFRATSKRTRIETRNGEFRTATSGSFRATSKRTRIETPKSEFLVSDIAHFQSNIQENKDWNFVSTLIFAAFKKTFRATSKRTRIETRQVKAWQHGAQKLSEQHPREQGLKPITNIGTNPTDKLSEQHPREQGLKRVTLIRC